MSLNSCASWKSPRNCERRPVPGKSYPRRYRLEALVLQELSALLSPAFAGELLTVRSVALSRDFGTATVFYGVAPGADSAAAQKKLELLAAKCRRDLARRLNMRRTPALVFSPDAEGIAADRLRDFLEKVNDAN